MWFGKKTIPQRTCAHLHFMPCYLNELVPDSSTDRHSRRRSSSALLLCMCPRTHMLREILKIFENGPNGSTRHSTYTPTCTQPPLSRFQENVLDTQTCLLGTAGRAGVALVDHLHAYDVASSLA